MLRPGGLLFSKTYMTGVSGEDTGVSKEGEPNTFLEMPDGPFHQEYGIIRLTAEEEIPDLYGIFPAIEYDWVVRTDRNRSKELREWLITCRK